MAASMLVSVPMQEVTWGRAYADPEKDGASTWSPIGPAYLPNAPPSATPAYCRWRPMRLERP